MSKGIAFEILKNMEIDKNIFEKIYSAYCFELYSEHDKALKLYKEIMKDIDIDKISIFEASSLLLGISEYARINKDKSIIKDNITLINDITEKLIKNYENKSCNIFGDNDDRVNTSTLGFIYGGLLIINNFIKSDVISRKVKDIKNYVFNNNISKGTLVNGNKGMDISIDIILAVVPFGLFSPEDLVLVEAVKEIETTLVEDNRVKRYYCSERCDAISTLLLSWYYAEKGNYNRAKVLLNEGENLGLSNVYESCLYLVVSNKLESLGEIGNNAIIHKPYGNYNRYEPQLFERFPKQPKKGEKILINATTWPMNKDMEVYLSYCVNKKKSSQVIGELKTRGSEGFWYWEIGPFNELDGVEYQIFIKGEEEFKSQIFSFDVLKKIEINKLENIEATEGVIKLYGKSKDGKALPPIIITEESGVLAVKVGSFNKDDNKNISNLEVIESQEYYTAHLGRNRIEIDKKNFSLRFYNINKVIFETTDGGISWYEDKLGKICEIKCSFKAIENENYYGFGERFNDINQKGNSPDVYVYNQYKEQGIKTYIPVPFFISSKGYGFYIDTMAFLKYDMECSEKGIYSFAVEAGEISFNIIPGTPKQVISEYTRLTGKPVMLPKWAFGPWMSSNNWDSDSEVRKQVELTNKYDIPSTVLVIEAWSDEATYYMFNDATYEESDGSKAVKYSDLNFPEWGRWPDPKGMVSHLHDNGLKCILWQIPIMKYMNGLHHLQKDADEEYMIKNGFTAKNEDGTPYRMLEGWFKDSILMDYSNPKGKKWWFDKRNYLVEDVKVDGFKTDGGEFVFGNDIEFYDGKTGSEMRNLYPNDYIEAYYKFINEKNPEGGITFSRAGFTGAQNFPAHWAGDERSNFKAFRNSIIAGLNSGVSGISFWGWDLGGFSGEIPTAELFIRGAQMAAFCPIMQYHAESKAEFNQDRTPWNIAERTGDKRALDYYKFYAKLRMNLLPYIYNEALKSSSSGIPLMRALFVEYPQDEHCLNIKDQYLFGDNILVTPIVYEGAEGRNLYLPENQWIGFWDNVGYEGNQTIYMNCGLDKIPVFIKNNSIISVNLTESFTIGDSTSNVVNKYENLCFKVYGNEISEYEFLDDLGNVFLFTVSNDNKIKIKTVSKLKNFYLIYHNEDFIIDIEEYKVLEKFTNSTAETVIKFEIV